MPHKWTWISLSPTLPRPGRAWNSPLCVHHCEHKSWRFTPTPANGLGQKGLWSWAALIAIKVGQLAKVQTSAMDTPLTGKVERISLKVGRLDVVGTDPIAKTDARVVEVFILLDDSETVSRFTNMQVKVEIQP